MKFWHRRTYFKLILSFIKCYIVHYMYHEYYLEDETFSLIGSSFWIESRQDLLEGLDDLSSCRPSILAWVLALCLRAWELRASRALTDGLMSPLLVAASLSSSSLSDSELELLSLAISCECEGMVSLSLGRSVSLLSIGLERPATVEV